MRFLKSSTRALFFISILFLLFSINPQSAFSVQVTLAWDANSEPDVAGYIIHYGTTNGDYQYSVDVGNHTSCTISGLEEGKTYHFSATAYNTGNQESGYSDEVTFTVPFSKSDSVKIWFEAESGYLNIPMKTALDNNASSGGYIWVENGSGNIYDSSQESGYAEYPFQVPVSGEYVIWGRVLSVDGKSDSFFFSVDESDYSLWYTPQSDTWLWDQMSNYDSNGQFTYYLEAGEHTLIVKQREDGAKIDKIFITNDLGYIPQGMGEETIPQSVKIWFEAESGYLNIPMKTALDNNASSGGYIWVENGSGNIYDSSQESGYAEYPFQVPVSGEYVIWGRVLSVDGKSDSFFFSVDESDYSLWYTPQSDTWLWDQMSNYDSNGQFTYYLEAGEHTLIVKQREDGAKIDKIFITNDLGYAPE